MCPAVGGLASILVVDNSGGIVRFRGFPWFGATARLGLAAFEVFPQCGLKAALALLAGFGFALSHET